MLNLKPRHTHIFNLVIAIATITIPVTSGCTSKADEDTAAIRAMMEKQQAKEKEQLERIEREIEAARKKI
jgi:hypothetical protein